MPHNEEYQRLHRPISTSNRPISTSNRPISTSNRPISMSNRPISFTFPDFPFNADDDVFPYTERRKRMSHISRLSYIRNSYFGDNPIAETQEQQEIPMESQETIVPVAPFSEEDEEKMAEPVPENQMSKKQITVIMGALCLALFLAALDMTIISTSLPTISKQFDANEAAYTWMASSYLLANASCLPIWGKLSDIWGRRIMILLANVLFLVGSLVGGLASGLAMFLVGRAVQGVGGGGLIILGQICVSDLFSPRERPIYYALFGATWAVAGSLGPVLGGVLTQEASWRWCFYINLPVGGICLVILVLWLKIESPKTSFLEGIRCIDWLGTATIVGGTIMLLFALEFGGISHPWNSPTIIGLIIGGMVTLCLFGYIERHHAKYPIMPPGVFETKSNILILGCNWVHASLFISGSYFLPIYFQTVLGVGPVLSGVYILPQVIGLSIVAMLTGVFIRNTGRYIWIIRISMAIAALGYGLFIDFKPHASWPRIIIYQIISGIGAGPNFQAPLIALQNNMPPADVAAATSTFGFVRQLSTSSSIVFGSVVYQNVMRSKEEYLTEVLGPKLAPSFLGSIAGSNIEMMSALTPSQKSIVLGEYTNALGRAWMFYAAVGVAGCIFSIFIKEKKLNEEHQVTKTGLEEQERGRQARMAAAKQRQLDREEGKS